MSVLGKIKRFFTGDDSGAASGTPDSLMTNNGEILKLLGQLSLKDAVVTPRSAHGHPVAFHCVDKISSIVAANPHKVMRKIGEGREVAYDHDQYRLVSTQPNQYTTQTVYTKTVVSLKLLYGNSFERIKRDDNGRPIAYYIWHPTDVTVKMISGVLWYKNWKTGELVDQYDMIHDCDTLIDPYTYVAPSRVTIARAVFAEAQTYKEFTRKFIKNGAHLGHLISFSGAMKQDQLDLLNAKINNEYSGSNNSGKTLALGGGATASALGQPLKDAQFLETLERHGIDIGLIFGFKPGQIGGKTGESFNSLEQYNKELLQYPILPHVKSYQQSRDGKIFRPGNSEYSMKIDLKGLLEGDIKSRVELYKSLGPALSLNDVLKLEDMNTFKEGDVRIAQLNSTTLERLVSDQGLDKKIERMLSEVIKNHKADTHE